MEIEKKDVSPGIVYVDGRQKTPNEKMYLVLLTGEFTDNDSMEFRDYEWIIGRQKVYEYLRDVICNEEDTCLNIHESKVISETVNILDAISVYTFMVTFKDIVIDDTGFDIEEYNIVDGADINGKPEE